MKCEKRGCQAKPEVAHYFTDFFPNKKYCGKEFCEECALKIERETYGLTIRERLEIRNDKSIE